MTGFEIAAIITAFATPGVIIFTTIWTNRKVDAVQTTASDVQMQVTTMNSKSLANIADDDESRRISAIPPEQRSPVEEAHLATAAIEGEQTKSKTNGDKEGNQ